MGGDPFPIRAFGRVTIFVFGVFLGYAGLKTNSLYNTTIMHALMNLGATIQVAAFLQFVGKY
jgi:membrane protease YdiL (CAAX protease family)